MRIADGGRRSAGLAVVATLIMASGWGGAASAQALPAASCPDDIEQQLRSLPIDQASRTRVVGLETPWKLYEKAIRKPNIAFVERDGNQSQGVILATVPVAVMWMAINDEDHHDEGGYLPVRASVVLSGSPTGSGRRTFQYFQKAGIGRWWVNRLEMNIGLYEATDGKMWELGWKDVLDEYPGDEPPIEIDGSVPKVKGSVGAWLMVPLGENCTLVEYAADGDLGGVVGALQWLAATRTLRNTMQGMLEMAEGHFGDSHEVGFVRPDGSALVESAEN